MDPAGRFCFQTTYLNNHVFEYFEHDHYQLIWVLRNPFSVVVSHAIPQGHSQVLPDRARQLFPDYLA